ncbi:hypothetical protein HYW94_02385 [Candidatus Uhrbacteria bacterium]|nr:hypothetical protein [Candidatus Uhrbacteria bacterium]
MDRSLNSFISSIQDSRLSRDGKSALVASLQKNGITQGFADFFTQTISREAQERGEMVEPIFNDFDKQFTELLKEFEKKSALLEKELSKKLSQLDPLDTKNERNILQDYEKALKSERTVYEKKVKSLSVTLSKKAESLS